MPLYTFRCPGCGSFDLHSPMSAIPTDPPCPVCTAPSSRVYTPPRLTTPGVRHQLADLAAASAERPGVTTSIPAAAGRPPREPRRAGRPALPRP